MNPIPQCARDLFLAAVRRPADEWDSYLVEASGGDDDLRRAARELLDAHLVAGSFLESPAPGLDATHDEPQVAERPGAIIDSYKLLEQIGEGGFGVVFLAEQTEPVRRKVALKVLKPGMDSRQVIARFEAERQALAIMDHPNIARVFGGGTTPFGRPYFVMELVKGVPITEYCDQNHLTPRRRLELFLTVCQAVQHAHMKGIIHRDLKPSNVLVSRHDTMPVVKVIDFGVAKALGQELTDKTLFTGVAQLVGTPLYMSPEQAGMSDLDIDTRSDIYSLGVLLYELLTGTTPFDKERLRTADYDELRRIIREEEPARPSTRLSTLGPTAATVSASRGSDPKHLCRLLRGELDWIVMKALEKDRSRRYETSNGFAADIQRYLADEPVQACPPSARYRLGKFVRRNKRALGTTAAAALVLLLAVAGLAASTFLILQEQQATKNALEDLRRDSYFHRIALAHRELSENNLKRALELLEECPDDLRDWEWRYLMRLCRVGPISPMTDESQVNSIAFSPVEDAILASAGGDGSIKVWNIDSGRLIKKLEQASGNPACSVAFHPGGKHVAAIGADKHLKVWEWATGEQVFDKPCDASHGFGTAHAVAFSPDGRHLVAADNGVVTFWDWKSSQVERTIPGPPRMRISLAFSRDGQRLATGNWAGNIKLLDPETGGVSQPAFLETMFPITVLAFSKDGAQLATANFGRRVDVWNTTTGELEYSLPHPGGAVLGLAISPDGRRLATVGEERTIRLWDTATRREVLSLRGHTGWCGCLAFSADGNRIASASEDKTIRVWDARPLQGHEGQELLTWHTSNEVWTLAVSPDGKRIVSAGSRMPVRVHSTLTDQHAIELPGPTTIVFGVAWHGQRIAAAGGTGPTFTVKVWNSETEKEICNLPELPNGTEYLSVAFGPDGKSLVTGSRDGKVQIWNAENAALIGTLGKHDREVRGVVFSPKGGHLASASGDGRVKVWAWDRQRLEFELQAWSPGVYRNVAFSPDDHWLVAGSAGDTVKIWDVRTGKELEPLRGHTGAVCAMAFSPNGRWLATAGEDSTIGIWDTSSWQPRPPLRGHTGLISTLAFIDNGRLISGSRDHTIRVWDAKRWQRIPRQ